MPESLLWVGSIPPIVLIMCLPIYWSWLQSKRDHERTRETLTRLDQERRAELDRLELAGKMDPFVRGAIAGGQVGVGRATSLDELHARLSLKMEETSALMQAARSDVEETATKLRPVTPPAISRAEYDALRRDVDRLLAERPQGYRRAG